MGMEINLSFEIQASGAKICLNNFQSNMIKCELFDRIKCTIEEHLSLWD